VKRKQRHGHKAGAPATRSPVNWLVAVGVVLLLAALGIFGPRLLKPGQSHGGAISNGLPAAISSNISNPPALATTDLASPAMDDPVSLLNYGTELLGQGKIDEAIEMYLRALKLNAEDEEVHFNLAYAYARQGRTEAAIKHYSEALKVFPDYVEAHNNLGNLLLDQRQYDEAIKHFSASLQIMPENTLALNSFGRALAEQGQTREAIVHFSEAVRLRPDYLEARCNLANAYVALGKPDEAVVHFSEVLRLKPNFPPAVAGMARARETQAGKRGAP